MTLAMITGAGYINDAEGWLHYSKTSSNHSNLHNSHISTMFPAPSHYSSLQDRLHHNHSLPVLAPAPAMVSEPRAAVYWCCLGAGPLVQLLASLLLPALLPPAVTSCRLRRGKWAATFIARINAAITGLWVSRVQICSSEQNNKQLKILTSPLCTAGCDGAAGVGCAAG